MMLVGTVYPAKQPTETFPVGIDFDGDLNVGETITASVTTARIMPGGADASVAFLTGSDVVAGSLVLHRVQAGTAGITYRVQMHITTSASNQYEHEVDVPVRSN